MTKEECIEVLQALWKYKDCEYSEHEIREALNMPIETLEQPTEEISKELKKRVFWEIGVPKEMVAKELGCKTQWDCVKWLWILDILQKHGFAICKTEGFLDD